MHDEISKFGHELNGVNMRGIDDDCAPFSLSYCLNKMRCGVAGVGTVHEIIANVASVLASDSSAYHMVGRQFIGSFGQLESNYIPPVPPSYFKIGDLVNMDHNEKVVCIAVSNRFPLVDIGDGVSVNISFFHVTWFLVFSTCIRFYLAPTDVKNNECSWDNYSVWVPQDGHQVFWVKCQK